MSAAERMRTEVIRVTPQLAAEWLAKNTENRPIKRFLVDDLCSAILNGRFLLTHQPIAFAPDGRLLDGQHRLTAVVESGKTVPMLVAYNADPSTFYVIDAGTKRSIADGLAITHRTPMFAAVNVAACRVVAIADRVLDLRDTTPWNHRTALGLKLDRATVASYADSMFEEMNRLILEIKDLNQAFRLQSNWLAALFVIRRDSNQDVDLVDEFVRGFITGSDLPAGDVRLRLRDAIANNPAYRRTDARLGFGVTVKAWNLFVIGDSPKVLRFTRDMAGAAPL